MKVTLGDNQYMVRVLLMCIYASMERGTVLSQADYSALHGPCRDLAGTLQLHFRIRPLSQYNFVCA